MARLTSVQEYAILGMDLAGHTVDEIADKLGKPSSLINEYLESKKLPEEGAVPAEAVEPAVAERTVPITRKGQERVKKQHRINMSSMMKSKARESGRTITQMTKGASERQDALRKAGALAKPKVPRKSIKDTFHPLDHMPGYDSE